MEHDKNLEITGIIQNEDHLAALIDDLLLEGFDRHEISIQANPNDIKKKLGKKYIHPKFLEDNPDTPRKSIIQEEDFNWYLGFSIGIPLAIGMIIGALIAGDIENTHNIVLGVIIGGIIGGGIGAYFAYLIKKSQEKKVKKQLAKGGIVIWINTNTAEKEPAALHLLQKHRAKHIHIKEV